MGTARLEQAFGVITTLELYLVLSLTFASISAYKLSGPSLTLSIHQRAFFRITLTHSAVLKLALYRIRD